MLISLELLLVRNDTFKKVIRMPTLDKNRKFAKIQNIIMKTEFEANPSH